MSALRIHDSPRPRRLRNLKSVPVLPSIVTLGNLFFGFLAMAKVADAILLAGTRPGPLQIDAPVIALFETAAMFVFLAMVFDALDGAVARMTNQSTPFGAMLDSLADVVTFGVAPAFMTKVLVELHTQGSHAFLPPHPKIYYVAAAIYVLCAALRLARFNAESAGPSEEDHKEFRGLPSPAAAAVVCALIALVAAPADSSAWISNRLLPTNFEVGVITALPVVIVVVGLLMVSRLPYPHLVYQLVRGRHSFPFLAGLVVAIGIAAIEWQVALAAGSLLYVFSGFAIALYRLATTGRLEHVTPDDDDHPEDDASDDEPPVRSTVQPKP